MEGCKNCEALCQEEPQTEEQLQQLFDCTSHVIDCYLRVLLSSSLEIDISSFDEKILKYRKFLQDISKNCLKHICFTPIINVIKDYNHIRVASWNLTNFCTKSTTDQKIELIRETILCHEFDVVALQEVGEPKGVKEENSAINKLLDELRESNPLAKWAKAQTKEPIGQIDKGLPVYGTFIYTKSIEFIGIQVIEAKESRKSKKKRFGRNPAVAKFQLGKWKLSLINFHLSPRYNCEQKKRNNKQLKGIHEVVEKYLYDSDSGNDNDEDDPVTDNDDNDEEKNEVDSSDDEEENEVDSNDDDEEKKVIILLGDFNNYVSQENTYLKTTEYKNLFEKNEYTNTSKKSPKSYDAIIVPSNKKMLFSRHGVADIASKPDFPEDEVSSHKPIWADFKMD